MPRSKSVSIGVAALLALAAFRMPAAADDAQACVQQSGDVAIAACSRAIASGGYKGNVLAALHNNRGVEHKDKGDLDRAMADFNAAIRLDARQVDAYNNRGLVWERRGDLDRAIADYDEAIRLNPKYSFAYGNRSVVWLSKGDFDRAIVDCDAAIRLNPSYTAVYNNRGVAWHAKGDLDRAIADYSAAIGLEPIHAPIYDRRGSAWAAKGDLDRAIADYGEAIRRDPTYARAYANRGRANLYAGALPKALADLDRASALDRKDAYAALWLDIANKRGNLPSRLGEAVKQIDMTRWPAPIVRLYLGQSTPQAVLAAADDPNAVRKKEQVCDANFYAGELALQQGSKDEAKRLFGLVAAGCPNLSIEFQGATAELKVLGANP